MSRLPRPGLLGLRRRSSIFSPRPPECSRSGAASAGAGSGQIRNIDGMPAGYVAGEPAARVVEPELVPHGDGRRCPLPALENHQIIVGQFKRFGVRDRLRIQGADIVLNPVCNLVKQILFKVEVEYRLYPAPLSNGQAP